MRTDEKITLWSERIHEFQSSGQTCKTWCQEHHVPVSTMNYWMRKLKTLDEQSDDYVLTLFLIIIATNLQRTTIAERKNDMEKQEQEESKHIEALDRKIERLQEKAEKCSVTTGNTDSLLAESVIR